MGSKQTRKKNPLSSGKDPWNVITILDNFDENNDVTVLSGIHEEKDLRLRGSVHS